MGKKKQKKKQKKAAQDAQAASTGPSPLHRIGQVLLDQARSPAGRQLLAAGLIVAASALARDAGRASEPSPAPPPGPSPDPAVEPPKATDSTRPGPSDAAAWAGMALSALNHFIHRDPPAERK